MTSYTFVINNGFHIRIVGRVVLRAIYVIVFATGRKEKHGCHQAKARKKE
jgi:hypothetical protein